MLISSILSFHLSFSHVCSRTKNRRPRVWYPCWRGDTPPRQGWLLDLHTPKVCMPLQCGQNGVGVRWVKMKDTLLWLNMFVCRPKCYRHTSRCAGSHLGKDCRISSSSPRCRISRNWKTLAFQRDERGRRGMGCWLHWWARFLPTAALRRRLGMSDDCDCIISH